MASLEFGILEDWSTTSFMPTYRVDMDEDDFLCLHQIFKRISSRTGVEFDCYSSTEIASTALDDFIAEMLNGESLVNDRGRSMIPELVRIARHAKQTNKPLQFRGL